MEPAGSIHAHNLELELVEGRMAEPSVATHIQALAYLECASVIIFFVFLGILGWIGLTAWKQIQELRSRRVQPLIENSKGLVNTGKNLGQMASVRGKRIYGVALAAADAVGIRAQTTANVVRGTIPEAQRLPSEINATTQEVQEAIRAAQTVRSAMKAAQGVRAAMIMTTTVRDVLRAAENVRYRLTHGSEAVSHEVQTPDIPTPDERAAQRRSAARLIQKSERLHPIPETGRTDRELADRELAESVG